ncbi:MAG: hypothetical protein IJX63_06880 [Lachnospiraceae bacterium]|nr:hypothetical protein [Lachnospiraceae bacterium]
MNVFVGEVAAYGMLILIWTLLLVFFRECKIVPVRREAFTCSYLVMGIGFGYLLLGGFLYNLLGGQASVLQYDTVWGFGDYGELLQNAEDGSVEGIFVGLYLLLARGIGALFFAEYKAGLIYTSFLLTLLTGLLLQGILERLFEEAWQKRLWVLFFVLPYAHRLFLPSSHAVGMFLIVGAGWLLLHFVKVEKIMIKEKEYLGLGYGLVLTILASLNTVLYFAEMVKRG